MPVFYLIHWCSINDIQDHLFYLIPVFQSLFDCGPVIVAFVQVIPVHLVHSHSKHSLVLWIYPFLNHSIIKEFIEVDASCMAVVEDERMAKWLSSNVESLFIG